MNNIRLRDFELGPIVNRDLSRRIRTVNGITVDRKVVRNDIKLAGKSNSKTSFLKKNCKFPFTSNGIKYYNCKRGEKQYRSEFSIKMIK